MSIISSFFIGASGLSANSFDLEIVGDNIANSNTIGFKSSRAAFEDVIAQNIVGGQVGGGTRLQTVQKILSQGAIASTGNTTDLALAGSGFFVLKGSDGGPLFTRAGQLTVDKDGFLVTQAGLRMQGFKTDAAGVGSGLLGDLNLTSATSAPKVTANITLRGNLSADPAVPLLPTFSAINVAATSNFSSAAQVFDSLGNPHSIEIHFRKVNETQWEWHATSDGSNIQGGTTGTSQAVGTGLLTFDAVGALTDVVGNTVVFDPVGSPIAQSIVINFGSPINGVPPGKGLDGVVQTSTIASSMSFVGQDGFSAGTLAGMKIDEKGNINGTFSNGTTKSLGQVAVANFAANDQLERIGSNLFRGSTTAGDANLGQANTGGRGAVVSGALEQSNVDLANEFIRMIVAQRGFQANSKTIQTADQLLQELVQLKR